MAVYDRDPYENLAALNALVSIATGTDHEKTDQIQAAIEFCRNRAESTGSHAGQKTRETAKAYSDTVDRLIKLHVRDPERFGFGHWNLERHGYDPLFIRAHLIKELKRIAGYPEALLLITGLRQALCPPGKYWTRKRAQRYREAISYIENLALQYKTPATRLSLLFV